MALNEVFFKKPDLCEVSWSFALEQDPCPIWRAFPESYSWGSSADGRAQRKCLFLAPPSTLNSSVQWRYLRGRKMPMRKCGDQKKTNKKDCNPGKLGDHIVKLGPRQYALGGRAEAGRPH